ncbi:MAG: hypothetical protein ABI411_16435 [Tahibacter sp.]
MKFHRLVSPLAAALALILAAPLSAANQEGYAERLYADYAAAGSDVSFDVTETASGALKELSGLTLARVAGPTTYALESSEGALTLSDVKIVNDSARADSGEADLSIDGFDSAGWPIAEGTYRNLAIRVSVGKDVQSHNAVEFCWAAKNHCVVYDPNILFLDSIVNGQRELKASGWAPVRQYERAEPLAGSKATASHCGLASNPNNIGYSLTWGAYTRKYKNVYGITMVTKNLGSQQSGIRCTSSCNVAPFGYSNSSSAFANIPFSVDCGHAFGSGTTGHTGKFDSETKCAHRLTFSAKADASVEHYGSASVDIKWDTTGSIDSNGGHMIDTCGYF